MRFISAFLVCVLTVSMAAGQARPGGQALDSAKTFPMGEVVVTATRTPLPLASVPSPVEVIQREDIERVNGSTVADAIRSTTGLFLIDRGANGALKTASLRGTGSEHLLVLLNGTRLSSFQNDLVDFSLIPLENVERIEILRGGSSALYGADALGGVVNVVTKSPDTKPSFSAEAGTGSFGLQRYGFQASDRLGALGLSGGYTDERGKDNYPFVYRQPNAATVDLSRVNTDFYKRSSFINGNVDVDEKSAIGFTVAQMLADRGTPGTLDSATATSSARQHDQNVSVTSCFRDQHLENTVLNLNVGYQYGFETYVDTAWSYQTYYKTNMLTVNPQVQYAIGTMDQLAVGLEFLQGGLESPDFTDRVTRVQRSVYVSNEFEIKNDQPWLDRILLFQSIRYDAISDMESVVMPKLGMNVRLSREGDVHLRASYGKSFRAPSFNDLYYRFASNPNLKPERSVGGDVGLTTMFEYEGMHTLEATYFSLTTDDRIVFDLTTFTPLNIDKTTSNGVEFKYDGHFLDGLVKVAGNISITDARKKSQDSLSDPTYDKQIIYIPKNQGGARIGIDLKSFELALDYQYVGQRFTTKDNSLSLDGYSLLNVSAAVHIPYQSIRLKLKGEINNLADKQYEILPKYPMPGRTFRLVVGVGL